jgi:amidohydrolase
MVRGKEEGLPGAQGGELNPGGDRGVGSALNTEDVKTMVMEEVDRRAPELRDLALRIHAHPEVGFHEVQAAAWLTDFLAQHGFSVRKGICDMPTAFEARVGDGRPAIAFLAEYDALPEIGHACGHNLIAAASVGAALGAARALGQLGGSVLVIGTPAEEVSGGKVLMANRGWFRDLDAAMLVHPDNADIATAQALACQTLEIEFVGKAAHAAARPEAGINALEAMLLSFAAVNSLRQHIRSSSRVHGVITDGGQAVNVVPAHSAATFLVRARDDAYLDELKERVLNCFVGAATATGAELKFKWDEARYATMRNNMPLARLYQQNMRRLKRHPLLTESRDAFGSTDMGNVSQLVPSIQPYVAIAAGALIHSQEFAVAARSEEGIRGMLDAARAMALTAVDLLADPAKMDEVRGDFQRAKS